MTHRIVVLQPILTTEVVWNIHGSVNNTAYAYKYYQLTIGVSEIWHKRGIKKVKCGNTY